MQCLVECGADFESEWGLCWAIGDANCKNYQLWNHRRRCALRMGSANVHRELEFAAHFLAKDPKNYHIWAHRQVCLDVMSSCRLCIECDQRFRAIVR